MPGKSTVHANRLLYQIRLISSTVWGKSIDIFLSYLLYCLYLVIFLVHPYHIILSFHFDLCSIYRYNLASIIHTCMDCLKITLIYFHKMSIRLNNFTSMYVWIISSIHPNMFSTQRSNNNTRVREKTVRQESTYIIYFLHVSSYTSWRPDLMTSLKDVFNVHFARWDNKTNP